MKFHKGEVLVYRATSDTSGTATTLNGAIPMDTHTSMIETETVKSIRPSDGAAVVSISMRAFKMSMNGKTMPLNGSLQPSKMSMKEILTSRGQLLSVSMGGQNPAAALLNSGQMNSLMGSFSMPDQRMHVGDTWTQETPTGNGLVSMTVVYKLANAWTSNGKQFVAIQSNGSGDMSMQPSSSQISMSISGPMTASGQVILDVTGGTMRQTKSTSHIDMTESMNLPATPYSAGGPQTSHSVIDTTTTIQLFKVVEP